MRWLDDALNIDVPCHACRQIIPAGTALWIAARYAMRGAFLAVCSPWCKRAIEKQEQERQDEKTQA